MAIKDSVKFAFGGLQSKRNGKVAVAMSGGVDSGVAAALVAKAGYKAAGFHLRLWQENLDTPRVSSYVHPGGVWLNKCCSTESLEAARKTAHQLGMQFYIVDLKKIFKKKVVDCFLKEYAGGLTPNPCLMCNKFIKFGELLVYVKKLGYDYLATGHYARVTSPSRCAAGATPPWRCLLAGVDKSKDQSYFLYNLDQKQLARILFPIGGYSKKEVRAMAKKWKLAVAERPESQEICFFSENDYRPFLERHIKNSIKPGQVVDFKKRIIGRHKGLPLYTIGQRHGFEITADSKQQGTKGIMPPYYVVGKDVKENKLIVGFGKETEKKKFWLKDVSWINPDMALGIGEMGYQVRIRHQGELLKCKVQSAKCKIKVVLDEAERGIAPGQAAVFYNGREVLGGGIISFF